MQIPPTSRYAATEVKLLALPDGGQIPYLARRFVPKPERFAAIGGHVVTQGERPDHVAYQQLGDAEQYWRLCDANRVLRPQALTEVPGTVLRVTLPEGIAGPAHA